MLKEFKRNVLALIHGKRIKEVKKLKQTFNIANKANDIVKKLLQEGFQKSKVENFFYESGWHEQYAIFVMQFYRNDSRFKIDFEEYLQKEFPDCSIQYYKGCNEIEICGPQYQEFYDKHEDEMEEWTNKNWNEHKKLLKTQPVIFIPKET